MLGTLGLCFRFTPMTLACVVYTPKHDFHSQIYKPHKPTIHYIRAFLYVC